MTDAVVWMTHETAEDRDLSSAAKYGRVEFLCYNNDKPGLHPGPTVQRMYERLAGEYRDGDYICAPGGDYIAAVMLGACLATLGHKEIRMLRYQRERDETGRKTGSGFYIPTKFTLPERILVR